MLKKKKKSKKKGGEKVVGRKVPYRKECQVIHVEGMIELENHHFAIPN